MGQTLHASTNEVNPKHREKVPFGAGHWTPCGGLRGAFTSSQTAQRSTLKMSSRDQRTISEMSFLNAVDGNTSAAVTNKSIFNLSRWFSFKGQSRKTRVSRVASNAGSQRPSPRGVTVQPPLEPPSVPARTTGSACHGWMSVDGISEAARVLRIPDFNRNTHLNATEPAGSEERLRRSSEASYCGACRETKYSSSHRRNLGKQGPKSSSLGSEPPTSEVKVKKENGVVEMSEDIYLWIKQYPKVILCDIAKKCDACGHDCGYVLSDVVKTKTVRCFKQDMSAGFHFWPSCLRNNTHAKEERGLGKTDKCSSTQKKMRRCKHQHQKHLEAGANSQPPSSSTTQRFHDSRTSEDSALRSASGLMGKHAHKWDLRTDVGGRDSEEAARTRSENHRDKRIKLAEGSGCSSACSTPLKKNCIAKKPRDQRGDAAETNAALMSSEPSDDADVDAAEPKSFTCQRVKAYIRKISYSCARTNVSWPFLKGHLTHKAHDASAASSERVTMNQIQACSSNKQIKDILPDEPSEKQEDDGGRISAEKNGKDHRNICSDRANLGGTARAEESLPVLHSVSFSISGQQGRKPSLDAVPTSPFTCNGPEIDSSASTPSPSALGLSDYETAIPEPHGKGVSRSHSSMLPSHPPSSFLPKDVKDLELKALDKRLFSEETQLLPCSSLSSLSPHTSSSLSQVDQNEFIPQRTPPCYNLDPSQECPVLFNINDEQHVPMDWNEFMLPPVLSPVASPRHLWRRSPSCQSTSSSEEKEQEEMNRDASRREASPECHMPQIVKGCSRLHERSSEEMERVSTDLKTLTDITPVKPQSFPSSDEDACDREEEESLVKSEDTVEHGRRSSENNLSDPEVKTTRASSVPTEARSRPSSGGDDGAAFSGDGEQDSEKEEKSGPAKVAGRESDETEAQPSFFDEFMAYEQDILLVDVMQDDPELFENLPEQSLLRLGPARVAEAPKRKPAAAVKMLSSNGTSVESEQRLSLVNTTFHCNSPDITEDGDSRPWRPQSSSTPTTIQISFPATNKEARHVVQFDANNNHVDGGLQRSQPIQMLSSTHSIHALVSTGNGPRIKNSAVVTDFRRQKSNAYCRHYFSETLSCGFKVCRFLHSPVEGDEKFCVDTVARFSKNPLCLQKAGAVFTGYYHNNPPGAYFSMPVFLCLLWALLKAGMVSETFSVLGVSLTHSIVPGHEFLLALFNCVREKGLMGFVPELMQLTFKMASVGLELSLDCLDCVKNVPAFQQTDPNSMSSNHKLSTSASSPEYLNLAHAIVEIELCTKQEDWKRAGEVFRSICQSSYHPTQVERISGRIAIALLSESKDKLLLPFSAFAETVCQNEGEDSLIKSFVGRIGVSLMLRYHKTHQWVKGRKVVETMSTSRVNYTTLKGLFGNEDGASCCHLVTVAAELFILSGSVEGALNTLRENKWFLSSCRWPCEPADLENRIRVLMRLAEKTSHRDTLDVLCNLPGIKEPNDMIDVSRFTPLFNSHLQVCVERQILPVATDTVDLMLSKDLAVDNSLLQALLQKLGKQNLWLRAREVFKHSLHAGYYAGVSAPAGFMALIVPCGLGEVELALTFEMFLTVNASSILALPETTTATLSITLKRTESCESSYLTAGSRLLSAACIPQPKLTIHYTAVNSSQEQVFRLDVSSARRWLRYNHLWANEMWAH